MNFWKINWISFITIIKSEIHRFSRLWMQTLLPPAITMSLYFIIFGHFIGQRVGLVQGVSFLQFMAPGLIMMAVINNSFSNTVASFYSIRFQRSIEELLVSPTPNWIILLGFVLGGVIRGITVGLLITIIALLFTHLNLYSLFVTMGIVLLTATLFSLAGFTNAVFARSFDDIMIIPTFILTPLTYLGGVFYSLSQLPHFWKLITLANPIFYLVDTFRFGILGIRDVPITLAFLITFIITVLLFFYNLRLLNKGTGIRT